MEAFTFAELDSQEMSFFH